MSKVENVIESVLKTSGLFYIREYSFKDLRGKRVLRFDFAIFDDTGKIDFLIEFQGVQHYKPIDFFGGLDSLRKQHIYDQQKKNYCKAKKIPLLVFSYKEEKLITLDYILRRYDITCYNLYKKEGE